MADIAVPNVRMPIATQQEKEPEVEALCTPPWFLFFNLLYARVGAGDSGVPLLSGNAQGPWVDPTGTGSRATFDMDWNQTVSNPPTQGEVTQIVIQLKVIGKILGQLELDLKTLGAIE